MYYPQYHRSVFRSPGLWLTSVFGGFRQSENVFVSYVRGKFLVDDIATGRQVVLGPRDIESSYLHPRAFYTALSCQKNHVIHLGFTERKRN